MNQEILLGDYSNKSDQQKKDPNSQKKSKSDCENYNSGDCNIDYFHDLNVSSQILFSWVYSILKVINFFYKRKPRRMT